MKTVSANLQTHLDGEVTTLATLWRIVRTDGTEFYFTDHDQDILFDGNTYEAESSYQRTAVANSDNLSPDNVDVQGIFSSSRITESDMRAGLFDYATIFIGVINYESPADGLVRVRRGNIGEVTVTRDGRFVAELRGLTQLLSQTLGERYSAECRADLGDSRCKVPIDPPLVQRDTAYALGAFVKKATTAGSTYAVYENIIYECTTAGTTQSGDPTYNATVGATSADGTAVFTAREAWTRHATVNTVTNRGQFTLTGLTESRAVDDWFNGGALVFETGNNAGAVLEIKDWTQSSSQIILHLKPPFVVQTGDALRLYPGCDKRLTTCINRFQMPNTRDFVNGNARNFRGEPTIPGLDYLFDTPDSKPG